MKTSEAVVDGLLARMSLPTHLGGAERSAWRYRLPDRGKFRKDCAIMGIEAEYLVIGEGRLVGQRLEDLECCLDHPPLGELERGVGDDIARDRLELPVGWRSGGEVDVVDGSGGDVVRVEELGRVGEVSVVNELRAAKASRRLGSDSTLSCEG